MRKLAFDSIKKMQSKNKRLYDRNVKAVQHKSGDLIYTYKETRANKLDKHYTGSSKIVEILNNNNFITETGENYVTSVSKSFINIFF